MKKNRSTFENEVKDVLKKNEYSPSNELWNKIQNDLKRDKKKTILWLYTRIAAGLLLLIAFTFVAVNYSNYFLSSFEKTFFIKKNDDKKSIIDSIMTKPKVGKKTTPSINSISSEKNTSSLQTGKNTKNNSYSNSINKSTETHPTKNILYQEQLHKLVAMKPTFDLLVLQKKSITFSSLATLPSSEEETKKDKEKKLNRSFWLSLSGAPSYFAYNPQIDQPKILAQAQDASIAKSTTQNANNIKATFKPDFSYSFSLRGGFKLNKHIILETGIQYMNAQSQIQTNGIWEDNLLNKTYAYITTPPCDIVNIRDSYIAASTTPDTKSGPSSSSYYYPLQLNTTQSLTLQDNSHYMSIPLKIGYVIRNKRIGCIIFGSISPELLLSTRWGDTKEPNLSIPTNQNTNRTFNLSSGLSLCFNYKLIEQLSLTIEPSYRIFLFNTYRNDILNTNKPQITNMEIGLKYTF